MSVFLLRVEQGDTHVHVSVFAGPNREHRARAGRLTFRPDEWESFRLALTDTEVYALVEVEDRTVPTGDAIPPAPQHAPDWED